MTDWSAALESAFRAHTKFSGSSGSSGSCGDNASRAKGIAKGGPRTTTGESSGSVVPAGTTDTTGKMTVVLAPAPQNPVRLQWVTDAGTTRTTRTTQISSPRSNSDDNRIIEWLNRHPAPSPSGRCAWCGQIESPDAVVVPFGTATGSHAWLHPECWPDWHKARREQARRALQADAG
jgi:hypothetical protein